MSDRVFNSNPVTPKWVKIVLRTVGVINAAVCLLGSSFLLDSIYRLLTHRIVEPRDAPYFRLAFAAMTLINLVFVSVLLLTALRFIQAKLSAANLYSLTVLLLFLYFVASGLLWQARQGVGTSISAATGAAGGGTAPFEFLFLVPFLYPAVSLIVVQLLKRRYCAPQLPSLQVVEQ